MSQSSDDEVNVFNGIVQAIFWVGPYNDLNECWKSIPGLVTKTKKLTTQYEFETNETVIFSTNLFNGF